MRAHISLIIPAFSEEHYLPALLDTVDVARRRYARGAEAVEVIVADNDSTDRTAEIALSPGCRVVAVEKRSIAAARKGGAGAAGAELLAFVDADFQIHPETFNAIESALESGRVVVGATSIKLSRLSPGLVLALLLLRAPILYLLSPAAFERCVRRYWYEDRA